TGAHAYGERARGGAAAQRHTCRGDDMRASLSLGHGSGRGVFVAGLARVVAERTALTTMGVAAAHAPAEPSEGEHAERDPKDGADRAEYALHSRVVVPERVAEPGQESAPGGDSE